MLELHLKPGLPGGRRACLRELCGHDESFVRGTSSAVAVMLLDRLLVAGPGGCVGPGAAADLAVCDRDRLLAAIYRATFGDRIDTRTTCVRCREAFDLEFSLAALQDSFEAEPVAEGPDERGHFLLADGRRFRLPSLHDEQAVLGLEPAAAGRVLAARCLVAGDGDADPSPLLTAIERHAPVIDLEISAHCPHCGGDSPVHFDIQSFLLAALTREGQWLAREVHRIAAAYHWSRREILDLPRSQRQLHVALIDADADARRRSK